MGTRSTKHIGDHERDKFVQIPRDTIQDLSSVRTFPTDLAVRILETVGPPQQFYIGQAAIGSLTSAAVWQIQRIEITATSPLSVKIEWRDGNMEFDNVWDTATSGTYS